MQIQIVCAGVEVIYCCKAQAGQQRIALIISYGYERSTCGF